MSFQPRSSVPTPIWPKPCGRMAGLAAPLRASRPDDSEAKGLGSLINRPPTLLAHHAAAEAAGRGAGNGVRRQAARGGEDRAAEILFEPVGHIIPQNRKSVGRGKGGAGGN